MSTHASIETLRSPRFSSVSRSAPAELARLDAHFVRVLRSLEMRPPRRLSRAQKRARFVHLDRLEQYRRRALFPKNKRFPGRLVPHFIDDAGTRCAMGHLIERSGGRDLVQRIKRERNYARVRDLADLPELVAWLDANGLTVEEAARIQPTYCGPPAHNCLCGEGLGAGYIEGTLGDGGSSLTVTGVYGPVRGVARGDLLVATDSHGVGTTFDVVFASLGGDGKTAFLDFGSIKGVVTIPTTACWFPQVASIPGSLPLATVEKALSASSEAGCEQVLTAYDPHWGVVQGGPDCTSGPGVGGGPNSGVPDASAVSRDGSVRAAPVEEEDGGCTLAAHAAGSPALGLAISAALLVYRGRRAHSRR